MAMLLPGGRGAVEIGKAWPSFHRYAMGGAYGLRLAGSRADVAGLVSFFALVEFSGVPDTDQPIASVSHLHCPVLILQGSADVITRPDHADRLLAALQEHHRDGRLEKLRRQGHGFTYEGAPMGTCCNFSESATARSVDLVVEFAARLPIGE